MAEKPGKRNSGLYRADFVNENYFGEIKLGLSAIRGFRNALVQLLRGLSQWPEKTAYLVLVDPRVSDSSLADEMQVFTTALRPAIADHLRLVIATNGEVKGVPSEVEASILESVQREVEASRRLPSPLPRPDKQSEVLRVLLHQWVTDGGPMTADWVARVVGCNYRTVAATLEKLDSLVERLEDRRFQLKRFPSDAWARFIATSRKARATIDYVDQSGQPRSPESLLRRVASLARDDIAVGGVFGAKHYLPQLDLVGSPRLDLCVHTSAARTDLDFVDRLDAALVPARSRSDQPRVSVHFLRRAESLFRRGEARIQWADPIECLVDLCDAGLDAQANEFLAHLESYRGEIDG